MHPRRATRLLRGAAEGDRRAQAILASLAAGLLVGVMYLPLIFLRYGLYDDYGKGADPLRTLWSFSVSDGRPVGGVLYVVGFGVTRQISGFGILRAVCIILLAVGAAGLTRILAARTERRKLVSSG